MRVSYTIDLEHDCPPYLTSYQGMAEGLPKLLDLLSARGVRATFFATGDVARRFPALIRRLVDEGHELGCHGDTHKRFSAMSADEAFREIDASSRTLRAFSAVTSFRAPNLDFPREYYPILRDAGYVHDSSRAKYKRGSFLAGAKVFSGVRSVPASTTPSATRLPAFLSRRVLASLSDPAVLFFHPWEFVDMRSAPIPLDCRFGTGDGALAALDRAIHHFADAGARTTLISEL